MDDLRPVWPGGENNRHLITLARLKELGGFLLRVKGPQRLNRDLFAAIEADIRKHELISLTVYWTVNQPYMAICHESTTTNQTNQVILTNQPTNQPTNHKAPPLSE
jgi:hypothetical protein